MRNTLTALVISLTLEDSIVFVGAAPTGCGKTVLFELAVLRLMTRFINGDGSFVHQPGLLKTVRLWALAKNAIRKRCVKE